jgi:hypothetical protein
VRRQPVVHIRCNSDFVRITIRGGRGGREGRKKDKGEGFFSRALGVKEKGGGKERKGREGEGRRERG